LDVRPRSLASKTWIESQTPEETLSFWGEAGGCGGGLSAFCFDCRFVQAVCVYMADAAGEEGRRCLTLLQQHNARKPVVQVPQKHRRHAALVVQIPVDVKGLVGLDLHLAHALAGHGALPGALIAAAGPDAAGAGLVQRRVELVAPRRAVAVAVAVVVAQQVVAPRLLAAADRERLVDRREQVLGQVGRERDDVVEVLGRVFWVEPPEEVAGPGGVDVSV
jgi:hypothetical protein